MSEHGEHLKNRARPPNFSRETHHAQNQTRPPFQQTKPQRGSRPPKKIPPPAQNCGTNGRSPKTHYKIHRQTFRIPINPPPHKGVMTGKRPNRAENHADHPPKTRQSWGDAGDAPKRNATPSKTPRKLQKTKNKTENQNPTARQQIDQTWIDGQNSLNENTTTEKMDTKHGKGWLKSKKRHRQTRLAKTLET